MIPIRDNQASRRFTAVNFLLIAINVAVFAYEMSLGARAESLAERYAMVPARITHAFQVLDMAERADPDRGVAQALPTLATSMFLHGGILHLAGNMLYLFIFGAAVEEAMGHLRYLGFYLASGVAAALATAALMPESTVPVIGASGAVAGILGAYFVLCPRARVLTVLPLFVFLYFFEIPAAVYLLVWFTAQLHWALAGGGQASVGGGVAWWAHVGGFLFGMGLGPLLVRRNPRRRRS